MSNSSRKIVLVHGVFDLLHAGHIEHFRQASLLGHELYVSVVPDAFCLKRKPIYPQEERLVLVKAIQYVTEAYLCGGPGPEDIIQAVRPTIYVRPIDYLGEAKPELALLAELKIPIAFTYPISVHTSDILARIRNLA